ncbi:MAG: lipoyl synthase, partial [Chloroflexi bacterium]|nr:lipoyl synthase [Chloroflexota bacterium]
YVRAIEAALIDALEGYDVAARRIDRKTGVWVDLPGGVLAKIAAIGVRVSRGVSSHGLALNVSTDLSAFARMVPCGFAHEVASLERLGIHATVGEVGERVARAFARRFGRDLAWERDIAAPREAEVPVDAPVRAAADLLGEALAS